MACIISPGPADGLEHVCLLVYPAPLLPERLVRRFKRFLAELALADGQRVLAHCPNSGFMLGCLE